MKFAFDLLIAVLTGIAGGVLFALLKWPIFPPAKHKRIAVALGALTLMGALYLYYYYYYTVEP